MTSYHASGGARPGRKGCGYRVAEHMACKIIPALSIRQPWATAVVDFGKFIENRTRPTKYRGPLWVHASRAIKDWEESVRYIVSTSGFLVPSRDVIARSAIVGLTWVVGCEENTDASLPWVFWGQFGWKLDMGRTWSLATFDREPQAKNVQGALGLWRPTDEEAQAWEALLPEAAREAVREWRGR